MGSYPYANAVDVLSMYTLILAVYRALLKSAVSGIGHGIHTTKKMLLTSHELMLHCWHVSVLHCSEDVAQLPCQVTHEITEQQKRMTTVRFELTPFRTGA